jgi:hypothetical protein
MPVILSEKYYKPIQEELEYYFYQLYWKDIVDLFREYSRFYNAKSYLLDAIRSGKVHYENGVFTGEFNISISKELAKFAKYDARKKIWLGYPPSTITAAAVVANEKGKELASRIETLISEIPGKVEAAITNLRYSIDTPLFMASEQAGKDLNSLGIRIDMTPEMSDRVIQDYTQNMDLNIKKWTGEQTARLREMIEKNALSGYSRRELEQAIQSEYGVTKNKARFLGRQETSIFVSTVRDERYRGAGIDLVKWSTSHDIRVVGNPSGLYPKPSKGHGNHYDLNGKICKLSDPSLFADSVEDAKAGRWKSKSSIGANNKHAGMEYGCRCTYIPIIV